MAKAKDTGAVHSAKVRPDLEKIEVAKRFRRGWTIKDFKADARYDQSTTSANLKKLWC